MTRQSKVLRNLGTTLHFTVIRPGETIGDGRQAGELLREESGLDIWRASGILCRPPPPVFFGGIDERRGSLLMKEIMVSFIYVLLFHTCM